MPARGTGLRHAVRRLLAIPASEIGDLVVAQGFVLGALLRVRARRTGRLLRRVQGATSVVAQPDERRLTRLAVAVDRVSRFGLVRPTCLVRAVALERLVRSAQAGTAVVRVGVARGTNEFFAHAWIEIGGRVLGDEAAYVRRFTPLHDFSALAS